MANVHGPTFETGGNNNLDKEESQGAHLSKEQYCQTINLYIIFRLKVEILERRELNLG